MALVKAVVFDIGNVLIEWQPERLYDQIMGPEKRKEMFAAIDLHDMNEAIDRGANWRETVYRAAEQYPAYRDMIRLWHDRWIDMASPAIDGSVALLRALRANRVPVFALSNFGIETFAFAETRYPFLQEFDQRYISGHLGVTKPDPEIYLQLEESCGLNPDQLLFADDLPANIAAAKARGWQVHQFQSVQAWADCLAEHGLLPSVD